MTKVRTRKLWLNVRWKNIPQRISREEIIETLIDSVDRGHRTGDYSLPRGWTVILEWRNKRDAEMKRGIWVNELENSAESSEGFDFAVRGWLEKQL